MEERAHVALAEQGGVELHDDGEAVARHQVVGDRLDLAGRGAVKGAERDGVDEGGGELDVGEGTQLCGQGGAERGAQRGQGGAHVAQRLEVGSDLVAADPGEVVAHARVEDGRREAGEDAGPTARREHGHEERAFDVLREGLGRAQLLRKLAVVAGVAHVDARARDRERVVDLHGLQLEDAAAREPREHDVLRELGVGSGRRAERAGSAALADGHRQVEVGLAAHEPPGGQVEGSVLFGELPEEAPRKRCDRGGAQAGHTGGEARSLPAGGAGGRARGARPAEIRARWVQGSRGGRSRR